MVAAARMMRLAQSTRFAGLSRNRARLVLASLALLLLALLAATLSAGHGTPISGDGTDSLSAAWLYDGIVADVRHGGTYYAVAAEELGEGTGTDAATPPDGLRLPTLTVVEAAMPPWAAVGLLYLLIAGAATAWLVRLRPVFARRSSLSVAAVLIAAGLALPVRPELAALHEIWAGLLIALSLALRRPGRWIAAAGFAALAMLIRETAVCYLAIMAIAAWVERDRREAAGWVAGAALPALAAAAHAWALAHAVGPGGAAWPGWTVPAEPGSFVTAIVAATALGVLPGWLAAVLAGLALFGWAAWRDSIALRAVVTFCAFAMLAALSGRANALYAAIMVAPAFPIGLAFVPAGLRDLAAAAALRQRRITVTRLT